jgi:hypothetical protein
VAATGGASLNPDSSQVVVAITNGPSPASSGGGGNFGWLATLLLGLASLRRRLSRS